jgi:hypothetical protein
VSTSIEAYEANHRPIYAADAVALIRHPRRDRSRRYCYISTWQPAEFAARLFNSEALVGRAWCHSTIKIDAIVGRTAGLAVIGQHMRYPACFRYKSVLQTNIRLDGSIGCHCDTPRGRFCFTQTHRFSIVRGENISHVTALAKT